MHSAIYETYAVQCCIDLWSIRGVASGCCGYMCILLYMTLIRCSGVA